MADIDGGKMDGFVDRAEEGKKGVHGSSTLPACSRGPAERPT